MFGFTNPALAPVLGMYGMPSGSELIIVLIIVLLLFGKKLPSVMRSLGTSVVEFKKGVSGIGDGSEDEEKPVEKQPVPAPESKPSNA
ncbi:MAG: Sec-independent protein translocase subunit TatA/TatB [Planctomycetaceae bacterium]